MECSLPCPAHQGGIKDDLCVFSGGGCGGSDHGSSVESSCLSADPASSDDAGLVDQEGNPSHLDDMSSLMAQLPPLRRGLSRFYGGKSQSFTSLSCVKAVEDLPEPDRRSRRRSGCKKQMVTDMHSSSNLSKVIRKMARMRPPSRSPSGVSLMVCSSAPQKLRAI